MDLSVYVTVYDPIRKPVSFLEPVFTLRKHFRAANIVCFNQYHSMKGMLTMVNNDELLIAIDAGHGGWDNGATWNGRLEKDDNLRLAREVREQLLGQGINVLMTRDSDVYVSLVDRVATANAADADLFVSLHRNSYIEPTPQSKGIGNFIYLTAQWETSGRAAQYVLDRVVDVGAQSNWGVQRGNYYVLRRTIMPSMLLEMGFIINDIDNQLFDKHLKDYAVAITKGIMQYFELQYEEAPSTPPENSIVETQRLVNERFGLNMPLSGVYDAATKKAMVMALQKALNSDFSAGLTVDGILGPRTLAAFPNVRHGQRGNVVFVLQALLELNRYTPGALDGIFGNRTQAAVQMFQRDHYLTPDGIVGPVTLRALLGM